MQRVVHRELKPQALLVGEAKRGEPFGDRAQNHALRRDVFLSLHVRGPHDQAQTLTFSRVIHRTRHHHFLAALAGASSSRKECVVAMIGCNTCYTHHDTNAIVTTSRNAGRWLVLIHQLPARPSNLRVTIWRRLQSLGAIALRNSVYVLPNTAETREDFEWLRAEIAGLGGSATVMAADDVNSYGGENLAAQFREQQRREYRDLIRDIEKLLKRWRGGKRPAPRPVAQRKAKAMRERYDRIQAKDYFNADGGSRAASLLRELEAATSDVTPAIRRRSAVPATAYRGRTWVTRTRPGIDRMASAWFIRKFVDPKARFSFVASGKAVPAKRVPFDMYGVEFGHQGSHCTLETLVERFAIADPATVRLSQVVHDLDMKDERYGVPECAAVGRLVDGLRQLYPDDNALLAQGMIVMEALHRSFTARQVDGTRRRRSLRRSRRPRA